VRLAALTAGERRAAAARLGSSPEIRGHAFPETKLTWAWVRRGLRDTCASPRAQARHGEGSSGEYDGEGSSARRRNGGARVLGSKGS
jgi:hypothetical protein